MRAGQEGRGQGGARARPRGEVGDRAACARPSRERRGRAPAKRSRTEGGERAGREREEGERKKKREKKENGKKWEKERKRRGERNKERKRERGGASASALIAAAVGHAWRLGARERDARVEGKNRVLDTGVGTSFSGIGRSE